MKLLKIDEGIAKFILESGQYETVDKITKENLLYLLDQILIIDDVSIDPYNETLIKNQAHQIIYKNVSEKLSSFIKRKAEFIDESKRLFLTEYEKYSQSKS